MTTWSARSAHVSHRAPRSSALAWRAVLLGAAVYAGAFVGHLVAPAPEQVSLFRSGTAVLVCALALSPPERWWAYLLAAVPAYVAGSIQVGWPAQVALGEAVVSALFAATAAAPLQALLGRPPRLDTLRGVLVYLLCGAALPALIAASAGAATTTTVANGDTGYWGVWRLWLLGEAGPAVTLVPLVLVLAGGGLAAVRGPASPRYAELGLLALGLLVASGVALRGEPASTSRQASLLCAPLPFLLWAAVRFRMAGACAASLVVTGLALSGALHGVGPFAVASAVENTSHAAVFAVIVSTPLMCLAALVQERERVGADLRKSESKFRSLFESNVVPIAFWHGDGRITDANDAYLHLVGHCRADLEAGEVRWDRFTPPEQAQLDRQAVEELRRTGTSALFEKEYLRRDGRRVPVLIGAARLPGSVDEGLGFALDLTERRQAEAERVALLAQERAARADAESARAEVQRATQELASANRALVRRVTELQTLIDLVPIGIAWAEDPECRRILGNRVINRIVGASPGSNVSKGALAADQAPYRVFKDGRELATDELPMQYAAAHGVTVEGFESEVVRDDGTRVHSLMSAAPVFDERGRVRGCLGAMVDVTERKRVETRLRAAEALLHSTLDALAAHIAILDEQGTIIAVNRAWREFTDGNGFLGAGRGVGTSYLAACRSATGPSAAAGASSADGIAAVMRGERPGFRLEYPCHGPAGQQWFQLRVTRFVDGGLVRVVLAHENITETKIAEGALRQLTGRLVQARDEEQRRIARELHDGVAQILAAVAIDLDRLKPLAEGWDDLAQRLATEAMALNREALRQIRTLSYLLHPPELEAAGLASALHSYVEGFARRSGIEVELVVPRDRKGLPAELEMALFRVVQEALANVHRHSGSAAARVELERVGKQAILRVRDMGHGMSAGLASGSGRGGDTIGVGLASMRERLRQLGGRLAIASGPEGTTVTAIAPIGRRRA